MEVISIRKEVETVSHKISALLEHYMALCGNCLPTFWDVSVPS
jgi:hypothetical protein